MITTTSMRRTAPAPVAGWPAYASDRDVSPTGHAEMLSLPPRRHLRHSPRPPLMGVGISEAYPYIPEALMQCRQRERFTAFLYSRTGRAYPRE